MSGAPPGPPEGVVGLLFTDIEGSTRLARETGTAWRDVHARHRAIVRGAIEDHGGWVDGMEGDSFFATFSDPGAAAAAAEGAQRALAREPWPDGISVRVRMGLHVGHVERVDGVYLGLEIHRAARIAAAAHGGQVLLSVAARAALADSVRVEDLGLHRLKDFPAAEHLYCAVIDGRGSADFPPPRTLELRPTNLSAPGPDLVGRDAELDLLVSAVRQGTRLVTVTGAGGCGKSSLALASAFTLLHDFPGGVWWVPLATVNDPADLLPQIARHVRADLAGWRSAEEGLVARLGEAPTLLLLDNTEQLVDASPDLRGLLNRVPALQVLATSQLPLGLRDELVLHLGSLSSGDAVRLFVKRASVVRPGWRPTSDDVATIDEICMQIDRLPLSIELAAARLVALTPLQLLERLRRPLDVLRRSGRAGLERHRSLRSTLEWTLAMVAPEPRHLFSALGTFAGPVSVADVEAVTGSRQALDSIVALLEVAVLQRVPGDGVPLFRLPEALRQLAVEDLDASPDQAEFRRSHAAWVYGILRAARLYQAAGPEVYLAAARTDADAAVALEWAKENDPALSYRLAAAWAFVLSFEGRMRQCDVLLDYLSTAPSLSREARIAALAAAGIRAGGRSDATTAVTRLSEALDLNVDDPEFAVVLLSSRGIWHGFLGAYPAAIEDCERASRRAESMAVTVRAGAALAEAQVRLQAGQIDRARALVDGAIRLCAERACWAQAGLPAARGDLALALGRPHEALRHHLDSMAQSERFTNEAQLFFDLVSIHQDLAVAGHPLSAMEVLELARRHATEVFGVADFTDRFASQETLAYLDSSAGDAVRRRASSIAPAERTNRVRAIITHTSLPDEGGDAASDPTVVR